MPPATVSIRIVSPGSSAGANERPYKLARRAGTGAKACGQPVEDKIVRVLVVDAALFHLQGRGRRAVRDVAGANDRRLALRLCRYDRFTPVTRGRFWGCALMVYIGLGAKI